MAQHVHAIGDVTGSPADLRHLQASVVSLQEELDEYRRRSRRRLIAAALAISLLLHAIMLLYLAMVHRSAPGGGGAEPVSLQFALAPDVELSRSDPLPLEHVTPRADVALNDPSMVDPLASASLEAPIETMTPGESVAVPGLTGSGSGFGQGDGTLGGGAGGTSFFGVSSRGTRFAYIVDRSGSMADFSKLDVAKRELIRSIDSLPDYGSFMVLFFSDRLLTPDMQDGWLRARKSTIERFRQWMQQSVTPSGGTLPGPAFIAVMSLPVRPDVVFFMTDGEIGGFTAEDVAALNRRGKHVVINTIAFGDPASQELLQQIARDSGGVYRFVPGQEF